MTKYNKIKDDNKLGRFIIPCETHLEQNILYDGIIKRCDELDVYSYTDNCFTHTFLENVEKKYNKDTGLVYLKLNMRIDFGDRYTLDDIFHMKKVIERICNAERNEPRLFGELFSKKLEIDFDSTNKTVIAMFKADTKITYQDS